MAQTWQEAEHEKELAAKRRHNENLRQAEKSRKLQTQHNNAIAQIEREKLAEAQEATAAIAHGNEILSQTLESQQRTEQFAKYSAQIVANEQAYKDNQRNKKNQLFNLKLAIEQIQYSADPLGRYLAYKALDTHAIQNGLNHETFEELQDKESCSQLTMALRQQVIHEEAQLSNEDHNFISDWKNEIEQLNNLKQIHNKAINSYDFSNEITKFITDKPIVKHTFSYLNVNYFKFLLWLMAAIYCIGINYPIIGLILVLFGLPSLRRSFRKKYLPKQKAKELEAMNICNIAIKEEIELVQAKIQDSQSSLKKFSDRAPEIRQYEDIIISILTDDRSYSVQDNAKIHSIEMLKKVQMIGANIGFEDIIRRETLYAEKRKKAGIEPRPLQRKSKSKYDQLLIKYEELTKSLA